MLGHEVEPMPPKAATASYTSDSTKEAAKPGEAASDEAADTAAAEKSSPVQRPPVDLVVLHPGSVTGQVA